jgi:hypothetical protein
MYEIGLTMMTLIPFAAAAAAAANHGALGALPYYQALRPGAMKKLKGTYKEIPRLKTKYMKESMKLLLDHQNI